VNDSYQRSKSRTQGMLPKTEGIRERKWYSAIFGKENDSKLNDYVLQPFWLRPTRLLEVRERLIVIVLLWYSGNAVSVLLSDWIVPNRFWIAVVRTTFDG